MNNKNLLTLSGLVVFVGGFLPWINGPLGMSLSGMEGDGLISSGALFIVVILNLLSSDLSEQRVAKGFMIFFTVIGFLVIVFTMFRFFFNKGSIDPAYSMMISMGYGLVLTFFGSVGSLFFLHKRIAEDKSYD